MVKFIALSLMVGAAASPRTMLIDTVKKLPGVHWQAGTVIVGNFTYNGRADVAVLGLAGETVVVALATEVRPNVVRTSTITVPGLCSPTKATLRAGTPEYKPEPCPGDSDLCKQVRREAAAMKLATERRGQVIWLDDPGCDGASMFWDGERLAFREYSP
ncbi:MAG TPA: hypothetical protein VF400_16330 [Anaeromyxobacteraceae bacterium]